MKKRELLEKIERLENRIKDIEVAEAWIRSVFLDSEKLERLEKRVEELEARPLPYVPYISPYWPRLGPGWVTGMDELLSTYPMTVTVTTTDCEGES